MMEFESLMGALAQETGAAPFQKNEKGEYALVFDDLPKIDFYPLSKKRMILKARVVKAPENEIEQDRFLKEMMKINLARARTQEEVLSFEQKSCFIGLHREILLYSITEQDFKDRVASFVNCLEFWCHTSESHLLKEGLSSPFVMPQQTGPALIDPGIL